jgi:RNA polymerase sigma-70 factor (ECF subfamily)
VEEAGTDPEALLAARRARDRLDAVLGQMPDDLRAAFVLFEIEGFTKEEVAQALGIPAGTAASRLRRAREDFARRARHTHFAERPEGATA